MFPRYFLINARTNLHMCLSSEKNCPDTRGFGPVWRPVGPQSVTWRIHREVVLLLGWGRAILLQFAHPLVAQGVAEHSVFVSQPAARLQRLRSTIDSMLALTFGDPAEAAEAAERINAIHDRVHGELRSGTKGPAAGSLYSAHDAALLKWVHATLLDSFMLTYERCVGLLTPEEEDAYCFESSSIEPLLGIPTGYLPRTVRELQDYMEQMFRSKQVEVNETARSLAKEVLYPKLAWPIRPLAWPLRLFTIGNLPPSIRTAYGFSWKSRQDRALRIFTALIRRLLPLIPSIFKHWKAARAAEKRWWTN